MKTVEQAARDYAWELRRKIEDISGERSNAAYDGFLAGDDFGYRRGIADAQRWISVEDELPEVGRMVILKEEVNRIDDDGTPHLSVSYELGVWNSSEWQREYVENPTHWRPIERGNE